MVWLDLELDSPAVADRQWLPLARRPPLPCPASLSMASAWSPQQLEFELPHNMAASERSDCSH